MKVLIMRLALYLIVLWLASAAFAQEWSEGFEQGLGGARPYLEDPPNTQLEVAADHPAEGRQFIRATLPGKGPLEGFNLTATGLRGGRLATVTAQVRGRGEVWLCLISGNGWLYSPQTLPLTDQWQEVSLRKVLLAGDTTLGLHFLSRTVQQGAVFEVDEVKVTLAAPLQVYDAEVGPWRCEAEDFVLRQGYVAEDQTASSGKVARHGEYVALVGLPFPRTRRPVTVYLRVKPGSEQEEYRLNTTQGGNTQSLSRLKPEKAGEWQWLRFPPGTAGEVGDSFDLDMEREKGAVGDTALDAVVLSTQGDLEEAALDQAPPLFSPRPLILVSRAAAPPKLDGQADDLCWQNTVVCTDFLVGRSLAPAQEKTTARLCYDDQNLYLLFVCDEPLLDPAQQRRHEFVARVQERDGEVYQDDSCIVLLDPANTGKQVFDFTVNALRTVADARCPGPDLWKTRDVKWNSQAVAAGHIGDEAWTVEMSIPFADLTGKAPQVGDAWQACLGRIARSRKEYTSWNPSNRGFHDPYALGTLLFAGPTVGVTLIPPASLQLGKNPLTAVLTPLFVVRHGSAVRDDATDVADYKPDATDVADYKPTGVYLTSSVGTPTGVRHSYQFAEVADQPVQVTHPCEIQEEAELQVAYGVLDAATLQPLVLTPLLTRTVKSSLATLTLASDGPYELFLNGEALGRGPQANGVEIKAPLQKGANVFALRLERGTAAVRIAAPGVESGSARWKVNAADAPDAILPTTDDSDWPTAEKVGEHPTLGVVVGEPGKAVVLRHTLLWEKTRVWPTPEPALYIARRSNQHLTVIADGLAGRKLVDWTVYLAVPPEFEILGSTGYYGNVDYQPHFLCTPWGEQTLDGRPLRVARITANKPIMTGRHYIFALFNAFVRYREEAGEPKNTETSFVYWTEANDRTVVEPPQTVPVRLLPPLNGRQPQKLVWQLWGSFFGQMDDPALREATLQTMQAAGLNDIASGDHWTSDVGAKYGIHDTMATNFAAWCLNMQPYLQEHPDERLIGPDGKPNDRLLCMTLLLGDSWAAVEAKQQERLEANRPSTVDYDYEFGPFDGPHSCYCPRCLAAFREYAKLPADTPLDPQIIREQYDDLWVDFMAWRVAQMFVKFKETVHRLSPGTQFSAYSGYQCLDTVRRYGIDWQYVGQLQACDRVGCGYGRPVEDLPRTIEALAGIPAIFGALMQPYDTTETVPQSPITKARLLRLSLDATGGVLIYDRLPMDGRTWFAIAETTRLVATFEDLFLTGRRSGLPGLDEAIVQVLSDGQVTLVCALNDGSNPVDYRLPLPADAGSGQEFYSGREVAAGETVPCVLPAGEAAVYVLRK